MKKLLIIVMLLTLLLSHLTAQVYQCDCDEFGQYKVTAKSRLTMRIQPASDSEKVTSLSYGTEVMGGIEFGNYVEDVIEEKTGVWRKVFYGNYEGYMFDGFLEQMDLPSMEMGHYVELGIEPNESETLGLFGNSERTHLQTFDLKPMKVEKVDGYNQYADDIYPLFTINGLGHLTGEVNGISNTNHKLLPGNIQFFKVGDISYHLITNGTLVTMEDAENEFGPTHKIEDYSLTLIKKDRGNMTSQVLLQNMEVDIWDGYYTGTMFIEFMGDLDRDGRLDLIITKGAEHGGETLFMLSSQAEEGYELKLIQKLFWGGC